MKKISVPEFTILSDDADPASVDLFSLESRLGPIFDVLRHKETAAPLAMALYGSAGSGKTTALKWLEQRILQWNAMPVEEHGGHPRVFPVWFQPDKCNASECILRDLISEIILQTLPLLDYPDEASKSQRLLDVVELCDGVLGGEFLQGLDLLARRWGLKETRIPVLEKGRVREISSAACLAVFRDLPVQWLQSMDDREAPARIVVLLDGIDLCQAATVMEVFRAMDHRLNSSNILFVAALDNSVAQRLIQQEYKDHGYGEQQSRRYLNKIFQMECHIESPPSQIRIFYDAQVDLLNRKAGNLLEEYLDPVYKVYIDEAILHLSGNNLRKIKLLLNSTLMCGVSARRKSSDKEASLHFAQRVQVYLLQRWLSCFSVGASALLREEVWNWFVALSEEAGKPDSDFDWIEKQQKSQDEQEGDGTRGARRAYVSPEAMRTAKRVSPPEGLSFKIIPEWVWDLLKIPFDSVLVETQTLFVETAETEALSPAEQDFFEGASDALKENFASVLEVPVAELSRESVRKIVALNLSGIPLEAGDFPVIGKLESLQRLDLYNSGVDYLDWIKTLKNLKILSLSCTQVSDVSPLVSLVSLESIDLSYTQVDNLHPLAGLFKLKMLILYGTPVKSIRMLKGLKSLERLNLSQTHVTSEEIVHLQGLTSLKNLFLRETTVSQEQIQRLKQVLGFDLEIQT